MNLTVEKNDWFFVINKPLTMKSFFLASSFETTVWSDSAEGRPLTTMSSLVRLLGFHPMKHKSIAVALRVRFLEEGQVWA